MLLIRRLAVVFVAVILLVCADVASPPNAIEADLNDSDRLGWLGPTQQEQERQPKMITRNLVGGKPIPVCSGDYPVATRMAVGHWNAALGITAFEVLKDPDSVLEGREDCDFELAVDDWMPHNGVVRLTVTRATPLTIMVDPVGTRIDAFEGKVITTFCFPDENVGCARFDKMDDVTDKNERWRSYYGRAEILIDPRRHPADVQSGGTMDLVHLIAHELGHILALADYYCHVAGKDPDVSLHPDRIDPTTSDSLDQRALMNSFFDRTIAMTNSQGVIEEASCDPINPAPTKRDKDDYRTVYLPATVTNVHGAAAGRSVTLNWDQSNVYVESDFEIQRETGTTWEVVGTALANETSAVLPEQPSGPQRYRVVARTLALCPVGQDCRQQRMHVYGAPSAAASVTVASPPAAPSGLTVSEVTDSSAILHWNEVTNADGYKVQLDGKDVEATLGENARRHPFTGLTPGKAHTLSVQATRDGLESAFATLTLLKPPSSITRSTTAHNSVKYTWTDGNPTGSATGAEVKIGATGTRQTADSTEHHTFNNLSASTPYTFYIRLKNDQGPSAWRTTTVTTPAQPRLPKPSGLSVTNVGQNSLTLNWSEVADAGGYKVKRTGSSSTWTLPSTSRSFTFTGLTSNFRYTLYVQALPKTGSSKVASAWAYESRRTNSALPPPTPQPPTPSLTTCLSSARLEAYANWFTDDSHCRSVRASALWSALRSAGIEVGCISRLILGSGEDPMWERYQAAGSRTNFLLRSYDILWLSRSACPTGSGVSGSSDTGALNCAEAVKPETGPAAVSVGGAACVIVRGGGAVQVSDGERTLNLTLSNGRDWVLFAASEFTGSSAGAFWVYDLTSGGWIALYPPDGFELERHIPADAAGLPALLDAIAASAAPSVYPAADR